MQLQFTYTPQDIQEMLNARLPRPRQRSRNLRRFAMPVVLALALVWAIVAIRHPGAGTQNYLPGPSAPIVPGDELFKRMMILLAGFAGVAALIWLFQSGPFAQRGQSIYDADPRLRQPQQLSIDDAGLHLSNSMARADWPWPALDFWRESVNEFFVRPAGGDVVIIPKRSMDDTEQRELRIMLAERVGRIVG